MFKLALYKNINSSNIKIINANLQNEKQKQVRQRSSTKTSLENSLKDLLSAPSEFLRYLLLHSNTLRK